MTTYGSTITIINNTGCCWTLGADPLTYGKWLTGPINIEENTDETISVQPNNKNTYGSQGIVHYTVQDETLDQMQLSFNCYNKGKNICSLTGPDGLYEMEYSAPADVIKAMCPLVVTITVTQAAGKV